MLKNVLIISSEHTGHGHKSITESLGESFALHEDIKVTIIDGFSLGGNTLLKNRKNVRPDYQKREISVEDDLGAVFIRAPN